MYGIYIGSLVWPFAVALVGGLERPAMLASDRPSWSSRWPTRRLSSIGTMTGLLPAGYVVSTLYVAYESKRLDVRTTMTPSNTCENIRASVQRPQLEKSMGIVMDIWRHDESFPLLSTKKDYIRLTEIAFNRVWISVCSCRTCKRNYLLFYLHSV